MLSTLPSWWCAGLQVLPPSSCTSHAKAPILHHNPTVPPTKHTLSNFQRYPEESRQWQHDPWSLLPAYPNFCASLDSHFIMLTWPLFHRLSLKGWVTISFVTVTPFLKFWLFAPTFWRPLESPVWLRTTLGNGRAYAFLRLLVCDMIDIQFHLINQRRRVSSAPNLLPEPIFCTSGALQASHQRINVGISAIGLSLVTFFGIKKNIDVQACCRSMSTFLPPSPRLPRFLLLFLSSSPRGLWSGSHHILLLFSHCAISKLFPIRTLVVSVRLPLMSLIPHFSKTCRQNSERSSPHIVNTLPTLFSLLHNDPTSLHLLFSFFRICSPPLYAVDFVILCKSPARPSALLIICSTFYWCDSSIFVFSSSFFIFSNHSYHFCMVSSHPGWIHAFSQSVVNNSVTTNDFRRPTLPFDLIFFVTSFIIFFFCCYFISSPSVDSSCLLCRHCRLYSLNKEKTLVQQSSHHFFILYFLLLRTRFFPPWESLPL